MKTRDRKINKYFNEIMKSLIFLAINKDFYFLIFI